MLTKLFRMEFSKCLMLALFLCIVTIAQVSWAKDFGSAFKAALGSFPPYPIFGGIGGAWVAVPYPASDNPACSPHFLDNKNNISFYDTESWINFKEGPDTKVSGNGFRYALGKGVFNVSHVSIDSEEAATKMEVAGNKLDMELDVEEIRISYGLKINENIDLGISFKPWSDSDIKSQHGVFISSESDGEIKTNLKPGILYQPLKNLYLGLTYEYAEDKVKTVSSIFVPQMGIVVSETKEESISRVWRLGTSWRPWRGTLLAFDWQVGDINNSNDEYDINMIFVGIEQYIHENFAIRAGILDGSITLGAGFLSKNLSIQYSYINESLKDLEPYVGDSSTHSISIALFF